MKMLQLLRHGILVLMCFVPWGVGYTLIDRSNNAPPSPLQKALGAFSERDFNEAKRLIQAGRINDYDPRSDWFRTPLMYAVGNVGSNYDSSGKTANWMELVRLLIAVGADVNETGWLCYTPLHTAAEGESADLVKLLIDHGSRINRQNCHGQTALMIAASVGKSELVVKELLISGANPNIRAKNGKIALEFAKTAGIATLISNASSKQ